MAYCLQIYQSLHTLQSTYFDGFLCYEVLVCRLCWHEVDKQVVIEAATSGTNTNMLQPVNTINIINVIITLITPTGTIALTSLRNWFVVARIAFGSEFLLQG